MPKVTWNDLHNATQTELKKTYKLDQNGMEMAVRKHLDGANTVERRTIYQNFYSRKES